tara:strand:+ start:55 stop:468 length:414 start_codon:yes stop_codon:yes gene_type:complete
MSNTVQALLDAALGSLSDEEQEKTASEEASSSVVEILEKAAEELEKLAGHPALKSHEAAQAATPASVDASNTSIGDALKHSPKSPGTKELKHGNIAKHGSEEEIEVAETDESQSDRLRQALITKLRSADVAEIGGAA